MSIVDTQKTYWSKTGKYQELSDRLKGFVPHWGKCDTPEMELFRLVSNLYYDLHNNGLANASHKLPDLQPIMRQFKQQLFAEGLTKVQYGLVRDCWRLIDADYSNWEANYDSDYYPDNYWEDYCESNEPKDYYPEWDEQTGWFTEKLELAFEALVDAVTLVAAKALKIV